MYDMYYSGYKVLFDSQNYVDVSQKFHFNYK